MAGFVFRQFVEDFLFGIADLDCHAFFDIRDLFDFNDGGFAIGQVQNLEIFKRSGGTQGTLAEVARGGLHQSFQILFFEVLGKGRNRPVFDHVRTARTNRGRAHRQSVTPQE